MLAILGNLGPFELVLIVVIAVLVFGKNLPEAASKAYLQVRKLRGAVDDMRRDTGIDRELRNLERTVREAEWEARKPAAPVAPTEARLPPQAKPLPPQAEPAPPPPPSPTDDGAS